MRNGKSRWERKWGEESSTKISISTPRISESFPTNQQRLRNKRRRRRRLMNRTINWKRSSKSSDQFQKRSIHTRWLLHRKSAGTSTCYSMHTNQSIRSIDRRRMNANTPTITFWRSIRTRTQLTIRSRAWLNRQRNEIVVVSLSWKSILNSRNTVRWYLKLPMYY